MKRYGILVEGIELFAYDPEDGTPPHLHRVPLYLVCERFGIDTDYQSKLLEQQGLDLKLTKIPNHNGFLRETRTLPLADLLLWLVASSTRPRKEVATYHAWRGRVRENLRSLIQEAFGTSWVHESSANRSH